MRIITEPRDLIAQYVARKCGSDAKLGAFAAVGLVSDDLIVAGAVFYGYEWPVILMSIAADLMTPGFIAAITHYAFEQVKCKSIVGFIKRRNKASRDFAEHWGAKMRGPVIEGAPDDDLMLYQLMAKDAQKWLAPRYMAKLAEEVSV